MTDKIDCGAVNILSVGEGHIRLTFDSGDLAETIRAERIVKDMLRRGYALLVATKADDGTVSWSRAKGFDEKTSEYIVVDYDSQPEPAADDPGDEPPPMRADPAIDRPSKRPYKTKRVPAARSEAISVGRTAGG